MQNKSILAIGAALTMWLPITGAYSAEFFLRAAPVTNTLPNNGGQALQWGFALDSAFGALDGTVTVPGPTLTVPPGDTTLTIHLDNDLPDTVSVVIPGQMPAAGQAPVRNGGGRITAFTFETPSGNVAPVDYVWSGLRPGTYIYHSGSHPAVQRPLGLYGALIHDSQAGVAYSNVTYDRDILLFFSEVDPRLNQAVNHAEFGPGKMMTSTVDYKPGYFMVNGEALTNGIWSIAATPGERLLFRLINAGSRTRLPLIHGTYAQGVAEDGSLYPFRRLQYSLILPAHKTFDVLLTNAAAQVTWYDRRAVSNPPQPLDSNDNGLPDAWEELWFGGFTNAVPDADSDGDGFSNMQEYVADTQPLNAQSFVRIAEIRADGAQQRVTVGSTSADRVYRLFSRDGLQYGIGPWQAVSGFEVGSSVTTTLTDTNVPLGRVRAYKIEVDLP
ncbi:MAG: hypothetical protein PHW60_02180 [Kiritimatiellae bacterium]|nr:hypothetical protein [Kiritimatiellia bacterium]